MTLADLLTTLETRGALPASRGKDLKTSLRYLASALGHTTLEECPVGDACRDPAAWSAALETHFQALETQGRTISAVTRRNTRNNLRVVFRLAATHGLLAQPLPPRLLMKPQRRVFVRQRGETSPYQTTYRSQGGPRCFKLPQAEWPPDIQAGWRAYQAKGGVRLRETTFQAYAALMATYLGYLTHICGRTPAWDNLFDVQELTEFVRWHAARLKRPITVHGRHVARMLLAVARRVDHPAAGALADVCKSLKMPAPLHIKRNHMVSLRELERVANACLTEGRTPVITRAKNRHPGARRAVQFQRGVMLKLLVRVPLRQRNVREMQLGRHLYQDQGGHWQLSFSGDDLKIGSRGGQVNTYELDLSEDIEGFVPVLEEFLREYRPRLPGALASPYVFLTQRGNPYTMGALYAELSHDVAMRTGQRFYPHLIRTIWATQYLTSTEAPDWITAAVRLGDTVAMVMKAYHDIVKKDHHAKAKAFLAKELETG